MNHGTLEKIIRLEKSLFNLIWLRMIKSNTIIDPTQSPARCCEVSSVEEKISDFSDFRTMDQPSFTFQAGTSDLQLKASTEANLKRAAPRLTSDTRELAEALAVSRVTALGGNPVDRPSSTLVSTGVRLSSGCCQMMWATRRPFWQSIRESVRGGMSAAPPSCGTKMLCWSTPASSP